MKAILAILLLAFAFPLCDPVCAKEPITPGKHQSTAIIQILPTKSPLHTENFIANEIASFSMEMVLTVASLKNDWENQGLQTDRVQKRLGVTRIPGTDMARITVHSDDPAQGKRIVNAIISSYIQIRGEREREAAERALRALDHELVAQADLVQDHRKELTVLIQQYGIPYFSNTTLPLGTTEMELLADSRKKLHDLQIEMTLLRGKLRVLEEDKAEREKLIQQIEIVAAQIELLGEIAEKRQDDAIALSLKQNRYQQSLSAYQQSLDLLNRMKNKQQDDRIALKMPREVLIVRQKAR